MLYSGVPGDWVSSGVTDTSAINNLNKLFELPLQMDSFTMNGTSWIACEDLQQPDGAIVMVSASGEEAWYVPSRSRPL